LQTQPVANVFGSVRGKGVIDGAAKPTRQVAGGDDGTLTSGPMAVGLPVILAQNDEWTILGDASKEFG
jgi:hypothetical protein